MLAVLFFLSAIAAAAPSPPTYGPAPVFIPLKYKYGGYPRVVTDITYPASNPIETIVDLGSSDFWVYGPNAIINYGSQYLGVPGPCNLTAKPFYNWPKSKTHTKPVKNSRGYSYGGNGKLVPSYFDLNDTVSFGNDAVFPPFKNQNVAISNYTLIKALSDHCKPIDYDHSILGLSEYVPKSTSSQPKSTGPSFRQDALSRGEISSPTLSMWFDAPPAKVNGTFQGTALLGAVPKGKYSGELVHVAPKPPTDTYVGYYVARPIFKGAPVGKPNAKQTLKLSDTVSQCLIDSGSGQDYLPIDQDAFIKLSGLIIHGGYPAYNGTCESIPKDYTIDYTFAGLKGKSVTVKVPLRNYARGNTDYLGDKKKCGLSMELDSVASCTFGAPFFTSAFLAFNDEKKQIAIAQGGVSSGAAQGKNGIGQVTTVQKGQGLP
ncbi:hypothetical protein FH972_022810 [Carpinus fangiana]|uniref:Peptidase A1 domain-containing protein n=1 Tax=Carpinus fangiana TaxID=176857 RepID=A0A5N6KTM6_9ROSI|nr:hypothetical protein FH972_022810 [Carpinus fangiana]